MPVTYFEMRWPVIDPGRPKTELITEAAGDLATELPGLGLVPVSAPVYTWHTAPDHSRHPGLWLVARFAVIAELVPAEAVPA